MGKKRPRKGSKGTPKKQGPKRSKLRPPKSFGRRVIKEHTTDFAPTYREELRAAVQRTKDWGLDSIGMKLLDACLRGKPQLGPPMGKDPRFRLFFRNLSRSGVFPAEHRSNNCAPTHLGISSVLRKERWPHAPVITIGDVTWHGDSSFDTTEESLRKTLKAGPEDKSNIYAHVWLTFPDMTIVDATFMAWQVKHNGEVPDLNEPMALMMVGSERQFAPVYSYRPFLVGPEFIWRTGWVKPEQRALFEAIEAEWVRYGFGITP